MGILPYTSLKERVLPSDRQAFDMEKMILLQTNITRITIKQKYFLVEAKNLFCVSFCLLLYELNFRKWQHHLRRKII